MKKGLSHESPFFIIGMDLLDAFAPVQPTQWDVVDMCELAFQLQTLSMRTVVNSQSVQH